MSKELIEDLELIDTNDLINELKKRFTHLIVITEQSIKTNDNEVGIRYWSKGPSPTVIGLCKIAEKYWLEC